MKCLEPGKEDCYNQYVQPGATFYVSMQVRNAFSALPSVAIDVDDVSTREKVLIV